MKLFLIRAADLLLTAAVVGAFATVLVAGSVWLAPSVQAKLWPPSLDTTVLTIRRDPCGVRGSTGACTVTYKMTVEACAPETDSVGASIGQKCGSTVLQLTSTRASPLFTDGIAAWKKERGL